MADTIDANGVRIAYRLEGPENGPVVMLSNSLATNYGMWDAQIPALSDKYRVLRYDQRGHGGSEATKPPYSFDLLLEDACALIRALGLGPVHFCGLSMGGMTGQLFGAKRAGIDLGGDCRRREKRRSRCGRRFSHRRRRGERGAGSCRRD